MIVFRVRSPPPGQVSAYLTHTLSGTASTILEQETPNPVL